MARSRSPSRMTEAQLHAHPDWQIVKELDIPPVRGGMLAAPLCGRDGSDLGVIYLTDRFSGDFTADDERLLSARALTTLPDAGHTLLHAWYVAGWLHLLKERAPR